MNVRDKLTAARTALVLDQPFFGALALGLKLKEDPGCKTAWVNGRDLGYDPEFISGLSHSQITALLAHEVMHCAAGHPWRRDARDMKRWNVAADLAINQLLTESGFTLPKDALVPDGSQAGKSAEWIYARLPDKQDQDDQGGGDGKDGDQEQQPNPQGEVRDAPTEADADGQEAPTEAEWQQATQQAAKAAKARGSLPAGVERFAGEEVRPRVDWRSALRRFIQDKAQSDYSWSRPNRRYAAQGLYLPALESEELGEIAVAIDTSGSMDNVSLAAARSELLAIIDETRPAAVTVYYADSRVAHAERFTRDEVVRFDPKGGGGTDFRPVVEAANAQEPRPVCLLYVTDMAGMFPESSEVPILWVTDQEAAAPVGEVIRIE